MRFDLTGIPETLRARLTGELASFGMLSELVQWAARRGAAIADVVIQDEFTHDVVVALGEHWLVFDTT